MTNEQLEERARQAQREYFRNWRRKNPDKVRASNARYWAKRAARMAAEKEATKHED